MRYDADVARATASLNVLTREVLPQCSKFARRNAPVSAEFAVHFAQSLQKRLRVLNNRTASLGSEGLFQRRVLCKGTKACFASEIGYHGCPSRASIERFIDRDVFVAAERQQTVDFALHVTRISRRANIVYQR